jgi:hypothetical protein
VARLRRAQRLHRGVLDVVAAPRGTHVRHYMRWSNSKPPVVKDGKRTYTYNYYGDDDCCFPVSGPAHVILAGVPQRWATPGSGAGFQLFTPEESAAVQCFPPGYVLPTQGRRVALRAVGNALPPVVMTRMLGDQAAQGPPRRALN